MLPHCPHQEIVIDIVEGGGHRLPITAMFPTR
jgi:hypothetical protein